VITQWTLWAGTVRFATPILERVAAASAAGFDAASVSLFEAVEAQEQGLSGGDLRARGRDEGVELSILDGLTGWLPSRPGRPPHRIDVDEAMRLVDTWQAESVTALVRATDLPTEALVEHFARLCDRAAEHGARIHLEFAPRSGVPDLASAWRIVSDAGRPNGGMVFDTWHFFRSDPDFELLATVPGNRIFVVQVSDAAAEMVGDVIEDTTHRRRLPGDGSFDLVRVLDVLERIGALRSVGPEILSDELSLLSPAEAAAVAGARVGELLAQVLGAGWRSVPTVGPGPGL
jgi:sugar phosphate isomerase/epimerase